MTTTEIVTILKVDLQVASGALDGYLQTLVEAARAYITTEGITLNDSVGDAILVEMYAAYLYRQRREKDTAMPRVLRWALNNRLMQEKGRPDG